MHLRRALLLFAIVLGTAALVASLSRPVDDDNRRETAPDTTAEPGPATAAPLPASGPAEPLSFDASKNQSRRLPAGRSATLEVAVEEPGTVTMPGLGLSAPASPVTPARFEVLPAREGDYEIEFSPAGGGPSVPAGRLVVTSAG